MKVIGCISSSGSSMMNTMTPFLESPALSIDSLLVQNIVLAERCDYLKSQFKIARIIPRINFNSDWNKNIIEGIRSVLKGHPMLKLNRFV